MSHFGTAFLRAATGARVELEQAEIGYQSPQRHSLFDATASWMPRLAGIRVSRHDEPQHVELEN